jgi:hypothetical protein
VDDEEGMIKGIRLRAEGGIEPAVVEPMGIAVWVLARLIGLAAGVLFIVRKPWQASLRMGLAAILALLAFTYLQAGIWVRLLVDLVGSCCSLPLLLYLTPVVKLFPFIKETKHKKSYNSNSILFINFSKSIQYC